MRWTKWIIVALFCMLFLTSCWDQVEIDDRAFVIALSVDLEKDTLVVNYTFPNLPVITGQGGEGAQSFVRKIHAPSLYEANKLFGAKSNKQLNFDHTKVIILGEEVLKNEKVLKKILDQFERNSDFARTIITFATEGKAEDVITQEIQGKSAIGIYLSELYENNKDDALRTTEITLGDIINNVNEKNGTVLLPKLVIEDEELMVKGVGVIINYHLTDWMSREDVEKLSWFTGAGTGTKIKVPIDNEEELTVEFSRMDTRLKFSEIEKGLLVNVYIYCEGDVTEYTLHPKVSLFENENLNVLEEKINHMLEEKTQKFIDHMMEKYQVDIINTLDRLSVSSRDLWLKYEKYWNDVIANATFKVKANTDIRRIGVAK